MNFRRAGLLLVLALAVAAILTYRRVEPTLRTLPIGAAYAAKTVCSGVFLSGRPVTDIVREDLATIPFLSTDGIVVDRNAGTVDAKLLYSTVRAVYRENCGCTLVLDDVTEAMLRAQDVGEPFQRPEVPAEKLWPEGQRVQIGDDPRIDYAGLNDAVQYAFDEPYPHKRRGTRALIVVYDGRIVAEGYANGFKPDMPLTSWSMTKTVTGVLAGILAGEGRLNVFGPAPVPEWQNGGDPRAGITVDQLLRMSSGLQFLEEYGATPSDVVIMLYEKADAGGFAASFPLEVEPDSKWYYSSGTSNIVSGIIRDTIGGSLEDYLKIPRERLFDKLGMQTPVVEVDASGVFVGSSFMYCSPRDWARFGLFLMNNGEWNGEKILPEDWMEYMTTPTPGAPRGEYGAHLWLNAGNPDNPDDRVLPDVPRDAFYLSGYEGQRVIVMPSRKAIVVRMGLTPDETAIDYNELTKRVLEALQQGQ